MKISREWVQEFFNHPLPNAEEISNALTFHAFEVENIKKKGKDDILDVKVTPNRGHDCLSHRGIAKELSAILKIPMKNDPLRVSASLEPKTDLVSIKVEESNLCSRYIACYVQGVKIGPSPEWLSKRLLSIGQKSINNIVDIANFVMFDIGQPLHAFDADKLVAQKGKYNILVRRAHEHEKILTLDSKEYTLANSTMVIADGNNDTPLGIAGIKGGSYARVDSTTTNLILEAATFNGPSLRRTAQTLKLQSDASKRFEQVLSPELAVYAMQSFIALVKEIAGGQVVGFSDMYPTPQEKKEVIVSVDQVNAVLGTTLSDREIGNTFKRLDLTFREEGGVFTVSVPFERLDLSIPEDLIEEIARIIGYDKIPTAELPLFFKKPEINENFQKTEFLREDLISKGYSEVFTSVFRNKGEREVINKVGGDKPFLRDNLADGLKEALEQNIHNKDLLGLDQVKIFEIGTIWNRDKEEIHVGTIAEGEEAKEISLDHARVNIGKENLPLSRTLRYQPFSRYPAVTRDIALFVPSIINPDEIEKVIQENAGELLVRSGLFDKFEKEDKISYAFRLVFQSQKRTLTDKEVNATMQKISSKLTENKSFEIR
ncbi:MAG: phenylalanine--tRNA ligase subunit beta [bacterium]|nr:phenylalanine--tRNA ligase subunit beta [bacterium]